VDRPQLIPITQLLLLGNATAAGELGDVLWLALDEVRRLFTDDGAPETFDVPLPDGNLARVRPEIRVRLLAPAPVPVAASQDWPEGGEHRARAVIEHALEEAATSRAGVDHNALASSVQAELELDESILVLMTDLPITPPAHWRYAIWQPFAGGAVLSTAALDPAYWSGPALREADVDRLRVLKHRARAANATVVGSILGFYRCENPACFLFGDIDAVTRLDEMLHIGAEHAVQGLTGRGFAPDGDPHQPAAITTIRDPREHASVQA
jgi:hypothetical protein